MLRALLLFCIFLGPMAHADLRCNVDFRYGILVNKSQVRITDDSRTVYQINHRSQLFIGGRWVELDAKQSVELNKLARGLHFVVPKMIVLASEGVKVAVETVDHVYTGLIGQDHSSYSKIQSSLKRAQKKVDKRFIHAGNNYYISAGSLENVNEFVDEELELELEQAINTSLGGILSAISSLSANENVDESRIQDLTKRLEQMEFEIESLVMPQAKSLKQQATWFCNKIHHLNIVEDRLRASVPELKDFDVIVSQSRKPASN